MDSTTDQPVCHLVAVPYPGRGHVNPMMNLCKKLALKKNDILITFVVTVEWLGFISSYTKPTNMRFATIPNVLPLELDRAKNFPAFYEAVMKNMEQPFEQVLDQLELAVTSIIADMELAWAIPIANSRNIPIASLCTISASAFLVLSQPVIIQNRHSVVKLLEQGQKLVDTVPGISSTQESDISLIFQEEHPSVMLLTLESFSWLSKAQSMLINSIHQIETQAIDAIRANFHLSIYPIGPAIPYFELSGNSSSTDYLQWLDSQPKESVLYVSLGSFLSVSSDQMNEIAAGLRNSKVRYLWVARGESSLLKERSVEMGLVLPWCDQLKVLSHSSVGGFWTHCGWNSTLEAVFSGIPMLTFPINYDQLSNSKEIVEDWKIGWRVKDFAENGNLVTREEIAELVRRFMDSGRVEVKNLRKRAADLQEVCKQAVAENGSSETNLDAFINDIQQAQALKTS